MSDEMRKLSLKHLLMDVLNSQDIIGDDELDLQIDCLQELAIELEISWKRKLTKIKSGNS